MGQKTIKMVGSGLVLERLKEKIALCARIDRPILLIGERGTGKELAAQMLHQESGRPGDLYTVHCASFVDDPQMAESELFGHEKGSFTDAVKTFKGVFERAAQGTVFLDDIHILGGRVQAKLNRVLEYRTFNRRGSEKELTAKCRIIASTNRTQDVAYGINDDLLDRFRLKITLPPLKDRRRDLIPLFLHQCDAATKEFFPEQEPFTDFELATIHQLLLHPWEGNVRELFGRVDEYVLNRGLQLMSPTRIAAKVKQYGYDFPTFGNLLNSRACLASATYFPRHWLKHRLKLHPIHWSFLFRITRKDIERFHRSFGKNHRLMMAGDFIVTFVDFLAKHAQRDERWQLRVEDDEQPVDEATLRTGSEFWEKVRLGFQDSPPSEARTSCSEPVDDSKGPIPEFTASLEESLDDVVLRYTYKVYEANKKNATKAGAVLGMDRRLVGRKVRQYEKTLDASSRTG